MQLPAACWRREHCWAQEGKLEGMRFWARIGVRRARRVVVVKAFIVSQCTNERRSVIEGFCGDDQVEMMKASAFDAADV